MKMSIGVAIFLSVCFHEVSFSKADTTKTHRLTLNDGSELVGKIIAEEGDKIVFQLASGSQITVARQALKKDEIIEGEWVGQKFQRFDPNRTRLFFAPTARSLPQGKGYFSIYEIFFPMLAIGVTDFLTFAGGMSLFPGASEQIVYLAPKVRIVHLDDFDAGGGVLYMHVLDVAFGISYGVISIGSPRASVTGGLGWGFVNSEFSSSPVLMIGGELQISNSLKIITENWFPPKTDVGIVSFGMRFFGESIAGDFGLVRSTRSSSSGGFPFLPYIGFAYNF